MGRLFQDSLLSPLHRHFGRSGPSILQLSESNPGLRVQIRHHRQQQ